MTDRKRESAPDAGAGESNQDMPAPRARLSQALIGGFRALWDRLGLLLTASVTWTIVTSLPLSLERALPRSAPPAVHLLTLLAVPLFGAVPTAGIFSLAHRIATYDEASYAHFWRDGIALSAVALRLSLLQTAITSLLLTAVWFYARWSALPGRLALLFSLYTLMVWMMMAVYHWPTLIAQERGVFDDAGRKARRGALPVLRRAFFLALGRPFFTLGLMLALLLASALFAITLALPPLIWIGTMALLTTFALRSLLVQFGVLPPPIIEQPIPDELFRLPPVTGGKENREDNRERKKEEITETQGEK